MDQEKFKSTIGFAIEREIEAFELYSKLAQKADQRNVVVFFEEMAGEERHHRELLTEFLQENKKVELKLEISQLSLGQALNVTCAANGTAIPDLTLVGSLVAVSGSASVDRFEEVMCTATSVPSSLFPNWSGCDEISPDRLTCTVVPRDFFSPFATTPSTDFEDAVNIFGLIP